MKTERPENGYRVTVEAGLASNKNVNAEIFPVIVYTLDEGGLNLAVSGVPGERSGSGFTERGNASGGGMPARLFRTSGKTCRFEDSGRRKILKREIECRMLTKKARSGGRAFAWGKTAISRT